jgi:predicted nucleotide-binding protein (sugar kinase/HSP70/actin superfamily)
MDDRRIAFPALGMLSVVAERYVDALGLEVISPPPLSRRSLDIGVRGSPEALCIPCKLLYGNYVEAAEAGATELIMLGGPATCRLGYSARQQVAQLARRGLQVQAHTLDLYHLNRDLLRLTRDLTEGRPMTELLEAIRFLLALLDLIDALEVTVLEVRPRAFDQRAVDRALESALELVQLPRDRREVELMTKPILDRVRSVPQVRERALLRVGLVGDVYTILTPFLNHNLEVELGRMGVVVQRWFRYSGRISLPLPIVLRRDRVAQARRAGSRYLERDVGGFARSAVGEAALMAEGEVDGLIHVTPFNCTPEVVAQSALVALQRERGIPVLNLSFDEQTGRAGVMTRLEAFFDMLWAARRRRKL